MAELNNDFFFKKSNERKTMNLRKTLFMLACAVVSFCCWAVPIVSNVHMEQIEGTKDVRITYDLADNFNTQLWVSVSVQMLTNITTWTKSYLPVYSVEGDVRCWVEPGLGKEIIWHAGTDWNGRFTDSAKAFVDAIAKIRDKTYYNLCPDGNLKFTGSGWNGTSGGANSAGSQNSNYDLSTTVYGAGNISFEWRLTKGSYQTLSLIVDGSVVRSFTYAPSSYASSSYLITNSGPHTIVWRYAETTSTSGYEAYIQNVQWR